MINPLKILFWILAQVAMVFWVSLFSIGSAIQYCACFGCERQAFINIVVNTTGLYVIARLYLAISIYLIERQERKNGVIPQRLKPLTETDITKNFKS